MNNSSKTYWIDQPGCLGDLLFTAKIGHELSRRGQVVWPIYQHMWDNGINRLITNTNYVPQGIQPTADSEIIKLSDESMDTKYTSVEIDQQDYKYHIKYRRDDSIEQSLRAAFGIRPGEPFVLFNDEYSFNKRHAGVELLIPKDYDGKIVKMSVIPNVTIFDWCWLLENAEQIHTVDTSINYVIETLDLHATRLVLHPRHPTYTRKTIGHFFDVQWEWIDWPMDTWKDLMKDKVTDKWA